MTSLLSETLQMLWGLVDSLGAMVGMLLAWSWSVLLILHNDMLRLEGVLVGILFAWFFVHRDKNPFIRAMAAPLKIILDILDIIWDETLEALCDLYQTVKSGVMSLIGKAKEKVGQGFSWLTGWLLSAKDKVASRFKKEEAPKEE